MKTKIKINGKDVEIELTADQVKQINKASTPIMERIKSFEDACEDQGLDAEVILPYDADTTDADEINENAYVMLKTIIKSLNEGWTPDYSNANQYKYYPWFKSIGSGLGLSFYVNVHDISDSNVGSRLVFKTSELATYAGKQFINIYNQFNN